MKIAIAVHGRFHGFDLAAEVHKRGHLARLFTTYPDFAVRRFLPADVPVSTAPWLEAARRLHARLPIRRDIDCFIAQRFAAFVAARLPQIDLAIAWSGAAGEIIDAAHRQGAKAIVERGSSHIAHQTEVLRDAYARWGLVWHETDPRLIDRELAEYEEADLIVTSSSYARSTFLARGTSPGKVRANPYGVDLHRFTPALPPAQSHRPKRVLFVGRVGIRKGVPALVQAFASLPRPWELHLVGPIEPDMREIFSRLPMDRVIVRGPLPSHDLPHEYQNADIFCLPSLEEGFPLVLLQAMASGLPVIATPATGAAETGECGQTWISAAEGEVASLADALAMLAAAPDERRRLGGAARQAVTSGFSWQDYGDRALKLYKNLLG